MKDGGYDTFWFGKNDALASESFPLSLTEWHDAPATFNRGGPGRDGGFDTNAPNTMLINASVDPRQTGDFQMLQAATKVLERREQDRPFCIFLPLTQPHPPYLAPTGFDAMYKPGSFAARPPGPPEAPAIS